MGDTLSDYQKCIAVLAVASLILAVGYKRYATPNLYQSKKRKEDEETKNEIESKEDALAEALEARKPSKLWNTGMFFPDFYAAEHDSTTQQFLWYFQQARTSIRVCIYNFSFPELEYVICKQYERGLIVQFVIGQEPSAENLRKNSIPCGVFPRDSKIASTDQLMHNKFAVIDDEAVLVGSMNWTTEGILNNCENICVSTNKNHVKKYLNELFRLMNVCEQAKTFY